MSETISKSELHELKRKLFDNAGVTPEAMEFLRTRLENHSFSITYTHFPVVFVKGLAAASVDRIFIPTPGTLDRESLELCYAMGIHESGHVLYGSLDPDRCEKFTMDHHMNPALAHDLFNIIEDYRVNVLIGVSHPGAGRIMDYVHRKLVERHPPFVTAKEALLPELCGYPYSEKLDDKEKKKLQKACDLIFGVVTSKKLDATLDVLPAVYKIFEGDTLPDWEKGGKGVKGESDGDETGDSSSSRSDRSGEEEDFSESGGSSSASGASDSTTGGCFGGHKEVERHPMLSKHEREKALEKAVDKLEKITPKELAKMRYAEKKSEETKEFRDIEKVFEEIKKIQVKALEKDLKKLIGLKHKEKAIGGHFAHEYEKNKHMPIYTRCVDRHRNQINKLVRDVKTMFLFSRGYHTGQRSGKLNGKKAYRLVTSGDQNIFMKKGENKNVGNVAVLLLVDNSGSMGGDRIDNARQASIILHEVFRRLKVKHMIVGYSADETHHDSTDHIIYKYWNDTLPSYNLSTMSSRCQNRDGSSIRMGIKYFDDVDEKKKLMIIVSDGLPAASYYGGKEGLIDTVKAHKEAQKKKIKLINVGIGKGYDLPADYENRIKVDDVDELPKAFLKMLRKEMM